LKVRKKPASKNNHLEEAMALLIQNQASFLSQMLEMNRVSSERFARIEERLGRLEQNMETILRVLSEHARIMQALPEAIRDKIGFKPPKT